MPDGSVELETIAVPLEERGQGRGSGFVLAAKQLSDQLGVPHRWVKVIPDARGFYDRFPHLSGAQDMRSPDRWIYSYEPQGLSRATGAVLRPSEERVIPHSPDHIPCPTCGDPTKAGFCPRCDWSATNVNLDSDPLSNPPDPTKDMHRGIQAARVIPSHRWGKWFGAVEDLDRAEHRLWYQPNGSSWGRGLVDSQNNVWTWPEEEMDHMERAEAIGDLNAGAPERSFQIDPMGGFSMHAGDDNQRATMEEHIAQATGLTPNSHKEWYSQPWSKRRGDALRYELDDVNPVNDSHWTSL